MNRSALTRKTRASAPLLSSALAGCLFLSTALATNPQDASGPDTIQGVQGLSLSTLSTNTLLTWPSDPRESFLVLARSNATPEAQWTVLTNHMPASSDTNRTAFLDIGGAAHVRSGSNLLDYYCVLLIPDFWINPKGTKLDGGPQHSGADFLPIYTGTSETDEFNRPFEMHVEMLVDSDRASEEEAMDLRVAVDDGVERVNLGTLKKPCWAYATGFWLLHDQLTDRSHTLQLRTLLRLNLLVGPGEQFFAITNSSVRVVTTSHQQNPPQDTNSWWGQRLGSGFARKLPTSQADTDEIKNQAHSQIKARPFDLTR